jgi:hypothetical protein
LAQHRNLAASKWATARSSKWIREVGPNAIHIVLIASYENEADLREAEREKIWELRKSNDLLNIVYSGGRPGDPPPPQLARYLGPHSFRATGNRKPQQNGN